MASLPSKNQQEKFATKRGMVVEAPMLSIITPALDLLRTRPADTAHSEYGGLTKMLHMLLVDQVLTPTGMTQYAKTLRIFPSPPGWKRLQSPHHVLSYSLREHARWSIQIALMSRLWLQEDSVKKAFRHGIQRAFAEDIKKGILFGNNPSAVDIITTVLVHNVRANILLTADELTVDERQPEKFLEIVVTARRLFQGFCNAAANASSSRRRSRAGSIASVAPTTVGMSSGPSTLGLGVGVELGAVEEMVVFEDHDVFESGRRPDDPTVQEMTTRKATQYRQWLARPNVHIGLHYVDVMQEYGLPSLMMVLAGEMKHKFTVPPYPC